MSTTTEKRTRRQAMDDAEAFCAMFPTSTHERWQFAGSLRRKCPEVSDCEHVVIPAFGDIPGTDLFATPERVNLLFHHLDAMLHGGEVTKHVYGTSGFRWGPLNRGVDFRDFNHEIFCAETANWGSKLAIYTGPAEFSKRLVTGLLRNGRRNKGGKVWECVPCPRCGFGPIDHLCKECDGTRLKPDHPLAVPDEASFFNLAGIRYLEPERRV